MQPFQNNITRMGGIFEIEIRICDNSLTVDLSELIKSHQA